MSSTRAASTTTGHEITVDRQFDRYTKWISGMSTDEPMIPPEYDMAQTGRGLAGLCSTALGP